MSSHSTVAISVSEEAVDSATSLRPDIPFEKQPSSTGSWH